jgi:CheY-like chemotaxis protein
MKKNVVILIAEDDAGHFELIKRNLWLYCVDSEIINFRDGQEVLDFLFKNGNRAKHKESKCYLLLLDIRMPKVDGREVLQRIKEDEELRKIPVIMLTTTDEVEEIERCYQIGCSFYMVKPIDYNKFMKAVENLGAFLSLEGVRVPLVDGDVKECGGEEEVNL